MDLGFRRLVREEKGKRSEEEGFVGVGDARNDKGKVVGWTNVL